MSHPRLTLVLVASEMILMMIPHLAHSQMAFQARHQFASDAATVSKFLSSDLNDSAARNETANLLIKEEANLKRILKFTGYKGYLVRIRLQEDAASRVRKPLGSPVFIGPGNTDSEIIAAERTSEKWSLQVAADKEVPGFYMWCEFKNGKARWWHVPSEFSRAAERRAEGILADQKVFATNAERARGEALESSFRALKSEVQSSDARENLESLRKRLLDSDAAVKKVEDDLRAAIETSRSARQTSALIELVGASLTSAALRAHIEATVPEAKPALAGKTTTPDMLKVMKSYQAETDGKVSKYQEALAITFKGNAADFNKLIGALDAAKVPSEVGSILRPPMRPAPAQNRLDPYLQPLPHLR